MSPAIAKNTETNLVARTAFRLGRTLRGLKGAVGTQRQRVDRRCAQHTHTRFCDPSLNSKSHPRGVCAIVGDAVATEISRHVD